ncbi:protein EPIDERMAL PATTERNING FACTOR 2-like [Hibiscus syriacus]|uniref:protein EPIDERMAL PATTERNING FACTOR 2-like n=1 Tax=Hibiscus syriacus TaxID=106335 RepID=UPI001922CC8C|nr:protein EPIDERMAL PATTERNING FACTOR 2-like [Hibiscus syriacus]
MNNLSFRVVVIFLLVCSFTESLCAPHHHHHASSRGKVVDTNEGQVQPEEEVVGMELYLAGSNFPDCSHACEACFPCKRVMVSFKCSMAESCSIVYRCMCKGKYYHVPSY